MSEELSVQGRRLRQRMIGRAVAQVIVAPVYCLRRPAMVIGHVLTAFLNPWWWLAGLTAYHFAYTQYSVVAFGSLAWLLVVVTATQDVMEKSGKGLVLESECDSASLGNMFAVGLLVLCGISGLAHKLWVR